MTYAPRRGSSADIVLVWLREQPAGAWRSSLEIEQATGIERRALRVTLATALEAGAVDFRVEGRAGRGQTTRSESYRLGSGACRARRQASPAAPIWPPSALDRASARIAPVMQRMCRGAA